MPVVDGANSRASRQHLPINVRTFRNVEVAAEIGHGGASCGIVRQILAALPRCGCVHFQGAARHRTAKLIALPITGSILATTIAVPAVEALLERAFVPSCSASGPAFSPMPAPSQINLRTVYEVLYTEVEYPDHIYWLDPAGLAVTGTPGGSKDVLSCIASQPSGKLPRSTDTILWLLPYARTVPLAKFGRPSRLQASCTVRGPQRLAPSFWSCTWRRS
jgi:hypothetical protein